MALLKKLLCHQISSILKHHNHKSNLISYNLHYVYSNSRQNYTFSSLLQNPTSPYDEIEPEVDSSAKAIENDGVDDVKQKKKKLKPLSVLFREAVESCGKPDEMVGGESEDEKVIDSDVKKALRKLEKEIRKLELKAKTEANPNVGDSGLKDNVVIKRSDGDVLLKDSSNESKPKRLSELFKREEKRDAGLERTRGEPMVMAKLSPDMLFLLSHLYKEGYFNGANFLPKKVFDVSCFDDVYGREYIKCAAEKFGKDNQEISKWLSGSDVKSVAQFGCPSLGKKTVFAAKRMRIFFNTQEDTVCSKCVLKHACKFVNQSIWKGDTKNLHLVDVMKIITLYALEATHPSLVVPDEVEASVSRLLKEAVNLSENIAAI